MVSVSLDHGTTSHRSQPLATTIVFLQDANDSNTNSQRDWHNEAKSLKNGDLKEIYVIVANIALISFGFGTVPMQSISPTSYSPIT